MSNSKTVIEYCNPGVRVPNNGYRVVRDDTTGKYVVFTQKTLNYRIRHDGKLLNLQITTCKNIIKVSNYVFVGANHNFIAKIDFDGIIHAYVSLSDLIYEHKQIRTNGTHIYVLYQNDLTDVKYIIKKYDTDLNLIGIIQPVYMSNISSNQSIDNWNVIDDDVFTLVLKCTDKPGQKIIFFTKDDVLEEITEMACVDGSKYRFDIRDEIHVLNKNYALLICQNKIILCDLITKSIGQCIPTVAKPEIIIINNCEFIIDEAKVSYCNIPSGCSQSMSNVQEQSDDQKQSGDQEQSGLTHLSENLFNHA